jgi:hypothetical protein
MRQFYLKTANLAWFMLILSVVLYGMDYLIFGKTSEVVSSFLGNLAFLPLYVLLVTLIIERILKEREKLAMMQKMNMVIGVFFSEVGTSLMRDFTGFLLHYEELAVRLRVTLQWNKQDFAAAADFLACHDFTVDCHGADLAGLKLFLMDKRAFLLGLLENPNLLEHDEFTDLLWAVFHLTEELVARHRVDALPDTDLDHLALDIQRVYRTLTRQWLQYMLHLKVDYPYLFSLAVRTNPMDPEAHPELL